MKRFYNLLHFKLFLSFLLVGFKTNAQTVLVDSFTRADNTTVGGGWTEIETGAPNGARIVSNRLVLGSTTAGIDFVHKDLSGLTGPITTNGITNNSNVLTWAFNFRQTRADPSGFDAGNYGVGFVLAKTTTPVSTGNGYAVIIGQSGGTDAIRLVRFTGGTNANSDFTNIISGSDYGAEYISVRVTYDPATDNWSLYSESNASAFPRADPRNTTTQIGSTTSNTTYTATGNDLKYFGGFWNHSTGASDNGFFDDIFAPVVPTSSYSGVAIGANSEPAVLPSTTTAMSGAVSPQTNAIINFDFEVTDDANTTSGNDALPTLITQIVIPQGAGNDIADWTQAIQAAEISDGTNTLTGTINTNNLTFPSIPTGSVALGEVTDGNNKTYTLKITLKTALGGSLPTTIDGLNLAFKIDRTNFTTAGSATSTQFESGAGTVVESDSTNNTVAVVATKLNFVVQPSNVNQNATMAPSVTISANDPNNNRDLGYVTAVSVSSTGTMTGSPISATPVAGLATVGAIVHTVAGTGFVLTGTSGTLTATGNSSAFNVIALNPVINVTSQAHNSTYAYGSVAWGSTLDQTFTINNTGSAIMSISSLTFGGAGFAIQGAAPTTVAIGGSATFTVRFTPNAIGAFTGSVTINNNSSNQTAYVINFTGTGTPSNLSDVIANATYLASGYNSNILYKDYQIATITNTSNSIDLFKFDIRDGGSATDADGLPTILSGITFNVTNLSNIRTAALFNGNALVSAVPTINTGAGTIAFSGLSGANVTAADGSTNSLTLRVSFNATVTDNQQIQVTIASANCTVAGSNTSSTFAAFTSVVSSTTSDRNRIEVIADRLAFAQGPSNATNGASMSPAVTVRGIDVNTNLDLDYTGSVTVACSTPAALTSGGSATAVSGVATFGSIVHGTDGTYTMTASSSGLTSSSASSPYTITTVTFITGDYRTNPALGNLGLVFFSSTAALTTPSSPPAVAGMRPWQVYSGGTWTDVTGASASFSPEALGTAIPNIYVTNGGYIDIAGGKLFNNITVDLPTAGTTIYSGNTTVGLGIATGKTFDLKKGYLLLDGRIDMQGTAKLIIREDATMDINSLSSQFLRNASSTWEVENNAFVYINSYLANAWTGTEIFHEESYFEVTDWDETADINLFLAGTVSSNTYNGFSALFGNLYITFADLTSHWNDVLPAGTFNLTHGDFVVTNNDGSGSDNINLIFSGSSDVTIGRDMTIEGAEDVQFQVGAGTSSLTIKGNFIKNGSGAFALHPYTNNSATLNVDGNMTLNDGIFYITNVSAGASTAIVNLKGNLKLVSGAYLTNSNSAGYTNDAFNFTGGGPIQTVDVVPHASGDLMRIRFFVKTNSYVQFINQSVAIGTNSGFTVEADATLDFGFNGTTALDLTIAGTNTGTYFSSLQESILKITNPLGITTSGAFGNVQVVAGNRAYNQVATFWYIGKANQVTGNGLTTASGAKVVICDLATSSLELRLSNSTTMSSTTTVDAVYGGHLYIKVGRFIESTTAYITSAGGTLRMEPNTYYYIPLGSANLAAADSIPIPRLSSAIHPQTQYYLNGGTIELAATGANSFQSLRGNLANPKNYKSVTFSGANTLGVNFKNLTSTVVIDSTLTITGDAIVDCIGGGLTTQSFTGPGGLVMSGTNSRIRFPKLNVAQPELTGENVDYSLTGGFVEFYGSGATQQQVIRGNYDSPSKVVNYFNIEVNALGGNYEATPLGAGGNLNLNSSFVLQGTMNVNSPAVLRMDEFDFIYKHDLTALSTVNINAGAGLLYGSQYGITTVGLGGTGVDPTKGIANTLAGNIRTSARTFSTAASYGFVGNGGMSSGSALPTQVVGLYVYKNTAGDTIGLTNPVEVTSKLKFQNGIIKTNANLVNVSNSATTAIEGGSLTGSDKYVQGNLQRNTDGASSYTFPIGHASQNAQGFTIGVTGANNSTIKGFLETNIQTLVQSIAYCDIEKHSGTAGVENAGEGLSGYDGILDRITFNLKSPLQWDVVNPSGGITSYDITVSANGGQDITPAVSSNSLPIRYLMKNGEPGNTGFATGPGLPSFTATGFLACPNGYTLTGMTSFSKFTVNGADQDNTVLPIELIYFDANCAKEGYVDLNWSTASELNNDYYTIERSRDAVSFEQVKEVDAAGNSGNILAYNEKDESPILGTSYYRLKQTDLDGSFSYSKIVRVDCTTGGDESINVFYADGEGIVSTIFINNGERFNFSIYDDLGRIIYEEKRNIGEGFSRNLLNNKDLATGIYFVTAQSENRRVSVKLFVP